MADMKKVGAAIVGSTPEHSSDVSEVARNEMWRERIKKEAEFHRGCLRTEFSLHPKTLYTVTEKPQQTNWTMKYKAMSVKMPTTAQIVAERAARNKSGARSSPFSVSTSASTFTGAVSPSSDSSYSHSHENSSETDSKLASSTAVASHANPHDSPDDALLTTVKALELLPRQKSWYPRTAAQDYGWDIEPLIDERINKLWTKSKNAADVTKYADAYVASQGKSPFAGVSGGLKPNKASRAGGDA